MYSHLRRTIFAPPSLGQAIKEEKMEVTLGQLAERWNNVVWGMDPYKGGDVPLLKIAEEDFEALEVPIEMSPVQTRPTVVVVRMYRVRVLHDIATLALAYGSLTATVIKAYT